MTCPGCQFANPPGARFCAGCGQPLPQPCASCGTALVLGGKFCAACGAPVANATSSLSTSAAALEPGQPPTPPPADAEPDLESAAAPSAGPAPSTTSMGERRLVTILFADIVGSTSLGEDADPEDLTDLINGAFKVMTQAVSDAGGYIARLMGDGLLAFFGAPVSHEDDPLRAVRAALSIRDGVKAYGERIAAEGGPRLNVRVGLDSGLVVVGQVGSDLFSEYTTMGDAANTAARLQGAAPVGEILVSEETARLIRGAVELAPHGALTLKGKAQAVNAFLVTGPPPELGVSTRGLPGIVTPLVGREGERARLIGLFEDAVAARLGGWLTLSGEAGVGKSRLLATFLEDVATSHESVMFLRGRCVEQDTDAYSLIRNLLASRYLSTASPDAATLRRELVLGIQADLGAESSPVAPSATDSKSTAAKTEARPSTGSVRPGLAPERAARDLVHLVLGDAAAAGSDPRGLAERGLAALDALVARLATRGPLVVALEDLHWADDASLDAVARIADVLKPAPAFIIGNSRPILFVRRPHWGEGESHHVRLDLTPLSAAATARLVDVLVEGDEPLPEPLLAFIRERSEGNPYFIEELVRMLLAKGLLARAESGWHLDESALLEGRVPTTLMGMLQARLDALAPTERDALQRASVLGRVFWTGALGALGLADPEVLHPLRGRGLILARERSTFPSEREFLFRHALLRDAAYESMLRKVRPKLHACAATWLLAAAGERYGEFSAQIAGHAELAGDKADAARHYRTAGERALATYANTGAIDYLTRALDLWPTDDPAGRFQCLKGREQALEMRGERDAQGRDLDEMASLAKKLDKPTQSFVHFRRSWLANLLGDADLAEGEAREALELAGKDPHARANALVNLGNAQIAQKQFVAAGEAFRGALEIRVQLDDSRGVATALLGAGRASLWSDAFKQAEQELRRALEVYHTLDDLDGQAAATCNLAITLGQQERLGDAEPLFMEFLELSRMVGRKSDEGLAWHNLGFLAHRLGQTTLAEARYRQAIDIFQAIGSSGDESDVRADLDALLGNPDGHREVSMEILD